MNLKRQIVALLAIILAILLLVLAIPSSRAMMAPGEVRAALDIGSGTTNLIVAKVDPQTDKITAQLYEESIPVPYQKHLEQSKDNMFDAQVMKQGIKAIQKLKETAMNYGAKKVVAVATAAFRKSANAEEFAKQVELKTGVQIRIINQDEEGILAFRGALAVSDVKPENALVWDVGGGSMQLTSLSDVGTYLVEKGKTASIPFKNYVIEKIEKKDIHSVITPNPLSQEQMDEAILYAESLAKQTPAYVIEKINHHETKVLAVGNLMNFGVLPVAGKNPIQQADLAKNVKNLVGKTDEELDQGSLSEVAVTNPVLILGYMQGLNIHSMQAVEVNNASGALTYPPYWV